MRSEWAVEIHFVNKVVNDVFKAHTIEVKPLESHGLVFSCFLDNYKQLGENGMCNSILDLCVSS